MMFGCEAEMQTNVIQGKLLKDCNKEAVGNVELLLKDQSRQGKAIASDITASDGSFLLSYDMDEDKSGNAEISYYNGSFYQPILSAVPLNESYQLILLLNNTASVPLEIETALNLSKDTFFYALQSSKIPMQLIGPQNGSRDTIVQAISNSIVRTNSDIFYWGLGNKDFEISQNALGIKDSTSNHIPLNLSSCTFSEKIIIKFE